MLQTHETWNKGVATYVSLPDVSNMEMNIPTLIKHIGDVQNKTILDYGCGSGHFSRTLKAMGARHIIAADISAPVIELARRLDETARIQYVQMEENNLSFLSTESVDIAVANLVFMMIPTAQEMLQSLQEIQRVLHARGTFLYLITHPCFVEKGAHDYYNVFDTDYRYMQEGAAYRFVLQDADGNDVNEKFIDYHHTLTTYINTTLRAGFQLVSIEEITYTDALIEKYALSKTFQTFPQALLVECIKP
jgi:ubiquinone/menaquinone biosynthesis C-methylase UbiE